MSKWNRIVNADYGFLMEARHVKWPGENSGKIVILTTVKCVPTDARMGGDVTAPLCKCRQVSYLTTAWYQAERNRSLR